MNEDIDFYSSFTSKNSAKTTSSSSLARSSNSCNENMHKYGDSKYKVYSHYIQPGLGNNNPTSTNSNEYDYEAKRPKLNQKPSDNNFINNKVGVNSNQVKNLKNTNMDFDSNENILLESFIGVDTFKSENIFTDLINKDLLILSLDSKSSNGKSNFCFKGKCSIGLIQGLIKINGYYLNSNMFKWYDLYSPETNSYLSISNNQSSHNTDDLMFDVQHVLNKIRYCLNLEIDETTENKLNNFLHKFNSNTNSIFTIRPLKSQLCNYICYFDNFKHIYQPTNQNKYNTKNSYSYESNESNEFDFLMSKFGIYPVSSNYFNAVHIDNQDENLIIDQILSNSNKNQMKANLNDPIYPIIMPCGGKDVGKSTFLRYLINSLLNNFKKVAYIDCDPGQCEFTLSSCLTFSIVNEPIFGPPHTHMNHNALNKKCYFLGHLSPNDVPSVYLDYLRQCLDDYKEYISGLNNEIVPLVINTMGWNQGLGLCLLKESILLFKPTYLVQINHPVEANKNMPVLDKKWLKTADGWPSNKKLISTNPDVNLTSSCDNMEVESSENEITYELITLKSSTPYKSTKYSNQAPQKRLSARDHRNIAILSYFSKLQPSDVYFKPAHHLKPYKISWSKLALHVIHSKVDYEQIFRVFNASLVSLCHVDSKYIKKKEENLDLPSYLDVNQPINPIIRCLGFGIIRGINTETKEFYILTPESIEILNQVNLICKGMLNLPLEFFYEQQPTTPSPYISYSDNLQEKNSNLNAISSNPIQRKYLVHLSQTKRY